MEPFFLDDMEMKECLYKGNEREVVLGFHKKMKRDFVLKLVSKAGLSLRERKDVLKEAQIMKSLKHEHIIGFEEVLETKEKIVIGSKKAASNPSDGTRGQRGPGCPAGQVATEVGF